jgi:hypothetical protein
MTNAQTELAHRQIAAKHLKGIPARHNLQAIDHLQTVIALEEVRSRATDEEWEMWDRAE